MSGKVAIQKSTLEAIGEAVRGKEGSTDLIPVNTLADRINALPSGKLPQVIDRTITELTAEDLAGVENIGEYVFRACDSLTSVTIPDTVTNIDKGAFSSCDSLTNVTIGNGVKNINANAFDGCSNLTDITIGSAVRLIGDRAFGECRKITNVYYNGDIASWCNMKVLYITPHVFEYAKNFYIKSSSEEYELVTEVVIPNGATIIRKYVFSFCPTLTSITIPDSVKTIEVQAFYKCTNLVSVTIGNGITNMNSSSFQQCSNLIDFTISSPIVTNISFVNSPKLTIDSLKNIINALADYSGTENEGTYTLTLNSSLLETLEAEGATAPDGLTWSDYVLAKGWLLA